MPSSLHVKSTRQASKRQGSNFGIWLVIASVVIIGLVVFAIAWSNSASTAAIAPPDLQADWIGRTELGNPQAAVTIQAWEDFFCPACRKWNLEVKPQLFKDYIQTGKVRLEFHQLPLQMHEPASRMGALASECVAEQGSFWPYHDRLFAVQKEGQPAYTIEKLADYAGELKLNQGDFIACLTSKKFEPAINASIDQAIALQLNSTPSILINGVLVENPFDYTALKAQLDQLLHKAQ